MVGPLAPSNPDGNLDAIRWQSTKREKINLLLGITPRYPAVTSLLRGITLYNEVIGFHFEQIASELQLAVTNDNVGVMTHINPHVT